MTQREDGPAIARLLNSVDGGSRPTDLASIVGTHVPPEHGLTPAVTCDDVSVPENEAEDGVDVGPIHYAHKLHQAGEAAIAIVSNMCEAEFAMGNPRNLPEPILGWYVMTLTYQLCVLEAVNAPHARRAAHVAQLRAARAAFAHLQGEYAEVVRGEIAEVLEHRYRDPALADEDRTYGGTLS